MLDNLALVRRAYAALARRDLPALLDLVAPGAEWVMPPGAGPIAGAHRGREAILAELLVALCDDPARLAIEAEELFAVDAERVIVFGRHLIWPQGEGGEPTAIRFLDVVTMRGGDIARIQSYFDGEGFRAAVFGEEGGDGDGPA
jgi:uncharacterized protein